MAAATARTGESLVVAPRLVGDPRRSREWRDAYVGAVGEEEAEGGLDGVHFGGVGAVEGEEGGRAWREGGWPGKQRDNIQAFSQVNIYIYILEEY